MPTSSPRLARSRPDASARARRGRRRGPPAATTPPLPLTLTAAPAHRRRTLQRRWTARARQGRASSVRRARALAWTAIRETWEETGILVGKKGIFEPRRSNPATEAFQAAGLVPAPTQLDYIVRAVTPTHSPIRFDTRFFLGDGNKSGGNLFETAELEEIGWHSLDYSLKQLKIMGVTQFVLEEAWRTWRQQKTLETNRTTPILMRRKGIRVIRRE